MKSLFRCFYCGKGTRCHFCSWLVVYCRRDKPGGTEYEIPYKVPYIEMWEDVIAGINAGNYKIEELQEIFDLQKKALNKDCKVCDDVLDLKEIKRVSKKSLKVLKKSKNIAKTTSKALQNAQEILKFYQNLDDSIIGIVDEEAYNHFDYKLKQGNTTLQR